MNNNKTPDTLGTAYHLMGFNIINDMSQNLAWFLCYVHKCLVSFPHLTYISMQVCKDGSYRFYNNRSIMFFWKDCTSSIVYTHSFSVASYYWHPKHPKLDYEHYYKQNSLSMVSLKVYQNTRSLTSVHAQPITKQPLPVWILL